MIMWPFSKRGKETPSEVIRDFFRHLAAGDVDAAVGVFEPDSIKRGKQELRESEREGGDSQKIQSYLVPSSSYRGGFEGNRVTSSCVQNVESSAEVLLVQAGEGSAFQDQGTGKYYPPLQ
jgi:hypothetical protein